MQHRTPQLLACKDVVVESLVDPRPEALAAIREKHEGVRQAIDFSDHVTMLDETRPDLVVIATPHTLHIDHVTDCLNAGAHTLVEKPLSCTAADCRKLIDLRDQTGLVAAVSYQRHGLPIFQRVREEIHSGRHGQILQTNSHLSQDWLKGTMGTWRQDPALSGGGQLNDSGSHMIDILLWITGLRAEQVQAYMDNRGAAVDINSSVNIRFEGGAIGSLAVIGDASIWHERHAIWLEEASILIEGERLSIHRRGEEPVVVDEWPEATTPDSNFVGAIRGENELLAPLECGLATLELTESAWRSAAAGGRPVEAKVG